MQIVGRTDGEERVLVVLGHMLFDSNQMTNFGRRVGSAMVHSTEDNFAHQSAPDGTPWQPSLRAKATGDKTLMDKRRLYNSLNYQPLPDGVEWGTNVAYAPYLHYGAVIKAKNAAFLRFKTAYGWVSKKEVFLPPRPFLGFKPSDSQTIGDIIHDILNEAV